MIETPDGDASTPAQIAAPSDRLAVLVMGTNDLAKELLRRARAGPPPAADASLGDGLLAARAAGKVILDGVYNDVKNAEGFDAECAQGREMGFDGKTLIHPGQVEPANEMWAPTAEAIEYAQRGSSPRSRKRSRVRAWSRSTAG